MVYFFICFDHIMIETNEKVNHPCYASLLHSRFFVTQAPSLTNGCSHSNHIPFQLFYHRIDQSFIRRLKMMLVFTQKWAPVLSDCIRGVGCDRGGFCFCFIKPRSKIKVMYVTTQIERFSLDCRKTKTKVITLANHKEHRQYSEPIKTRSNYM